MFALINKFFFWRIDHNWIIVFFDIKLEWEEGGLPLVAMSSGVGIQKS